MEGTGRSSPESQSDRRHRRAVICLVSAIPSLASFVLAVVVLALASGPTSGGADLGALAFLVYLGGPGAASAAILWAVGRSRRPGAAMPSSFAAALVGTSLGLSLPSTLLYLAWVLNWNRVATGSSTSGIALLWVPPAALVASGFGAIAGMIAEAVIDTLRHRRSA